MAKRDTGAAEQEPDGPKVRIVPDDDWGVTVQFGEPCDWADVNPDRLLRFLSLSTRAGARVTLSIGKGGNSYGVNCFFKSRPKTWYPGDAQQVGELMEILSSEFAEEITKQTR